MRASRRLSVVGQRPPRDLPVGKTEPQSSLHLAAVEHERGGTQRLSVIPLVGALVNLVGPRQLHQAVPRGVIGRATAGNELGDGAAAGSSAVVRVRRAGGGGGLQLGSSGVLGRGGQHRSRSVRGPLYFCRLSTMSMLVLSLLGFRTRRYGGDAHLIDS